MKVCQTHSYILGNTWGGFWTRAVETVNKEGYCSWEIGCVATVMTKEELGERAIGPAGNTHTPMSSPRTPILHAPFD